MEKANKGEATDPEKDTDELKKTVAELSETVKMLGGFKKK